MVGKLIVVLVLLFLFFSAGVLYYNIPRASVKLVGEIESEEFSVVGYGGAPVFLENLRFNHNNISYFVDGSCSEVRRSAMVEAFGLFEWMTEHVSFYEGGVDADISV